MILTLANVFYVLVAIAMIALILLQRGSGAAAGSGFGAGASATVFGARGAANFLSKSTAILASLFFVLSMGMAVYHSRTATAPVQQDLGIMSGVDAEAPPAEVPAAPPQTAVPAAEAPSTDAAVPDAGSATPPVESQPEGDDQG